MGLGSEVGVLREGMLADLLVVDGDPLENIRILQDRGKLPPDHEGRRNYSRYILSVASRRNFIHNSNVSTAFRFD